MRDHLKTIKFYRSSKNTAVSHRSKLKDEKISIEKTQIKREKEYMEMTD